MFSPNFGTAKVQRLIPAPPKVDKAPPGGVHVMRVWQDAADGHWWNVRLFIPDNEGWLDEADPPKRLILFHSIAQDDGSSPIDEFRDRPGDLEEGALKVQKPGEWPTFLAVRHVFPVSPHLLQVPFTVRVPTLPFAGFQKFHAILADD